MKQKTSDNASVTKEDLTEVLKDYPTKNDLSNTLNASFEAFRQENAYQFQLMREDLHNDLSKFTSVIITAIDPLLKEMETRQQDRELTTAQIEDLKKRVTKLEHS